jgi:hypothetical protein
MKPFLIGEISPKSKIFLIKLKIKMIFGIFQLIFLPKKKKKIDQIYTPIFK